MAAVDIVVIGGSWGGMVAASTVLGALPATFPVPVVLALHRSPHSSEAVFVGVLRRASRLPVTEADDKDRPVPGHVYVAPADYHLLVDDAGLALSTDDFVLHSRPSIDVLFDSAVDTYGAGVIGVVLTGANADGAAGVARIRGAGGVGVVQDPATAERPEMPEAAIARAGADHVVDLTEIGPLLCRLVARPAA